MIFMGFFSSGLLWIESTDESSELREISEVSF